jgi:hypothetical protein
MHNKPKLKNPYPAIDFEKAYIYLLGIRKAFPRKNKFGRKELLEDGLGFSKNNGSGHNVVGALGHYNLIRREGSKSQTSYNITPEADRLLSYEDKPDEWVEFALKLSMSPVLFEYLYSKYPDGNLPVGVDTALVKKYQEVNDKNVGAIIRRYRGSLNFVRSKLPEKTVKNPENNDSIGKTFEVNMGDGMIMSIPESTLVDILKNHFKLAQ